MNGVVVTEGNPRMSNKIMSGKDGLGSAPMSQVAAQIMNVNGDVKATIASATMASMPAAYSSVGELNLRSSETVVDRFNSRTQKKALASQQTTTSQPNDKIESRAPNIIDLNSSALKQQSKH